VHREPNLAWRIVADADFNGDGVADLLWRNMSNGQVYVMLLNGSGLPATGAVVAVEPNAQWKIVQTPDLDGDGRADILWWNATTGQVYAHLLQGASLKAQGVAYHEPNTAWRIVASGDLAGSGRRNQVVWRNVTTGQVYLQSYGFAGGTFATSGQLIYTEPNAQWQILAAEDFNNDGRDDLLWRNAATGQVYVMLMNGGTIIGGGQVHVESNLAWKVVAKGDYNGDGNADLLWRNESTGEVHMMLMNGTTIIGQAAFYREPMLSWVILGPWEYARSQ
jgi:hypothetical protein